jgi:hypothetical protein
LRSRINLRAKPACQAGAMANGKYLATYLNDHMAGSFVTAARD